MGSRFRGGGGAGQEWAMEEACAVTPSQQEHPLPSAVSRHTKTQTHIKTSGGASSTRAGSSGVKSSQLKEVLDVLRVHLQSASDNDLDLDPETFKMFKSEFVTLCERTRKSRTAQTASVTTKGAFTLSLATQTASGTSSRAPSTSEGCSLPADTSTLCFLTKSATSTASVPSAFFPTSTSLPSSSCVC